MQKELEKIGHVFQVTIHFHPSHLSPEINDTSFCATSGLVKLLFFWGGGGGGREAVLLGFLCSSHITVYHYLTSKTKKIHLRFSIKRHSVRFPNPFLVKAAT